MHICLTRPENAGELEKTMLEKFYSSQVIRSLYDPSALPTPLHGLISQFHKNFSSDTRGTRLSDIYTEEERFGVLEASKTWAANELTRLDPDGHELLKNWFAQNYPNEGAPRNVAVRNDIYHFGQRFTTQQSNVNDSQVIFRVGDGEGWMAGSIIDIFSQVTVGGPTRRTWAIIQPYEAISPTEEVYDHYREWTVAGGRLYRNAWANDAVLVDLKDVQCHFASLVCRVEGIPSRCRLVLPLNKVSPCVYLRYMLF